jgi:uncharacterized protein YbjT (DUF2867 family)
MIAITGATGQLGRLVIDALLQKVPANQIVAAVRHPEKAADLAAKALWCVMQIMINLPACLPHFRAWKNCC